MISLKSILIEAKLYSYTTQELLDKVLNFEGKTLIFLDTETTDLEPNNSYVQITEISAMALDGSTFKVIGEYNTKVNLGEPFNRLLNDPKSAEAIDYSKRVERWRNKYKKELMHPADILKMTGYHTAQPGERKQDEKEALIGLEEFIKKYPNPLIIAHNATFDIKTISARRKLNGLPIMTKRPVLDTVKISRFFFIPMLLSMENNEQAKQYLQSLLAKTKFKSYSSSLGKLADAFKIKLDGWHQASEDVKMLFQILQKTIEFLRANSSVDLSKQQKIAGKKYRNMK